jgi:hypothetical protein
MIQCARYAYGFSGIVDPDEAERMAPDVSAVRNVSKPRFESTAATLDHFSETTSAGIDADDGAAPHTEPAEVAANERSAEADNGAANQTEALQSEPRDTADYDAMFDAVLERSTNAETLKAWFKSDIQRRIRGRLGIVGEAFDQRKTRIDQRVAELKA